MKQLLLPLLLLPLIGAAQERAAHLTERYRTPLSPAEVRYDRLSIDADIRRMHLCYANPAYRHLQPVTDSTAFAPRSVVTLGGANGRMDGDFLPYEGHAFSDIGLTGGGEYTPRSGGGTLFGSVRYARGRHEGIGWSAMRDPERYLPYISTDSTGGDFRFEHYAIEGGYAFPLAGWSLGLRGVFSGEQAHRQTDPRALTNTTELRADIGLARRFGAGHLLMLQGSIGRYKQHVSLRYWRPAQQDRFFVTYGFGLYDVHQSAVLFGYSRMYYASEHTAHLVYRSPDDRPLSLTLGLGYTHQSMETEESRYTLNLYGSRTHRLAPTLDVRWKAAPCLTLSLLVDADIARRQGLEHIYEQYLADETHHVYDYRLIDTRRRYACRHSENLVRAGFSLRPARDYTLGLSLGALLTSRRETYRSEPYEIRNTSALPHVMLDFHMDRPRSALDLSLVGGRSLPTGGRYRVDIANRSIQHLDFQHAFAPYAYRAATFTTISATATYLRKFRGYAVGATLRFLLTRGRRSPDAAYTGEIGFASTAPMVSPTPDRHDERWAGASLFVTF